MQAIIITNAILNKQIILFDYKKKKIYINFINNICNIYIITKPKVCLKSVLQKSVSILYIASSWVGACIVLYWLKINKVWCQRQIADKTMNKLGVPQSIVGQLIVLEQQWAGALNVQVVWNFDERLEEQVGARMPIGVGIAWGQHRVDQECARLGQRRVCTSLVHIRQLHYSSIACLGDQHIVYSEIFGKQKLNLVAAAAIAAACLGGHQVERGNEQRFIQACSDRNVLGHYVAVLMQIGNESWIYPFVGLRVIALQVVAFLKQRYVDCTFMLRLDKTATSKTHFIIEIKYILN